MLGVVVAWAGCGGSDTSTPVCPPGGAGSLADALAGESALIERGRADADFGHAFGTDSQALVDAADASRAQLMQGFAAQLGIGAPGGTAPAACSGRTTLKTGAVLSQVALALNLAPGVLGLAVLAVPANGMTPHNPMIKSETGTAADGSPTQTVTTIDVSFGSDQSTAIAMLTISSSIMAHGAWTSEAIVVNATMNVRPDARGSAPGTFELTADGAVGSGATTASTYHAEIHDTFSFEVNEAAHVASQDGTSAVKYSSTGTADATVSAHGTVSSVPGSATQSEAAFDESDGPPATIDLVRRLLFLFGPVTAALVEDGAESKWRGGTCVWIRAQPMPDATGKIEMTVEPNAQIVLSGQPYQKFEMSDLAAPVVATLAGLQSLSPGNQPISPPATFNYTAGGNFKDRGVVTLTSTSKRGIGTQSATFTVRCDDKKACPGMQTLNLETCQCECPPPAPKTCPGGQTLDPQTCMCACKLQCPAGQPLNTSLCACETSCSIDATTGTWPADCFWVGTARVTASESGQYDDTTSPIIQDHETWSLSYDASLSAALPAITSGTVTGTWHQVGTTVWPTAPCTGTITTDVSASNNVSMGMLSVVPMGRGMVSLYVDFGVAVYGMGTTTDDEGCGSGTTQVTPVMPDISPSTFVEMKAASGSTFSGTDPDAAPMYLVFADGTHARFNLTWDLRLVRR